MSESAQEMRTRLLAKQAAGRGAGTVAADVAAKLASEAGAPEPEPEPEQEAVLAHARTFVHQVAGANTIMPDGKKLVFGGRRGLASLGQTSGLGYYVTDLPEEITWLENICKNTSSQVTELVGEKVVPKRADPTIAMAVADAAHNTEQVFNPQVSAAVDGLGGSIAKDAAADQQ
jgi:hypothetical protein